ncbi:hypothetical protein BN1080_00969 [Planococcus massiliensis]|uniref:Uncharacterized protein n=1 Tax=Planococcus massiliensis TaxID=1499687 RepID=A0A098EIC3_9BACL|nr:hypothetical protein [Planococcus massiliensis]CEG22049.1 hypothetical protein BN1080_00969 [Planococcus massiliensis]
MELDFSPMQPFMDDLLMNLLIVIGLPLIGAIVLKYILGKLKLSDDFAGVLASFAFLYLAYKTFMTIAV